MTVSLLRRRSAVFSPIVLVCMICTATLENGARTGFSLIITPRRLKWILPVPRQISSGASLEAEAGTTFLSVVAAVVGTTGSPRPPAQRTVFEWSWKSVRRVDCAVAFPALRAKHSPNHGAPISGASMSGAGNAGFTGSAFRVLSAVADICPTGHGSTASRRGSVR